MSYRRFNIFSELLNRYLAAKIGQELYSHDLMNRACNCSHPSKVNGKCACEGKCQRKCLIYEVKCRLCDAIYTCNTQQTLKKRTGGHFSDVKRLLKPDKSLTHLLTTTSNTLNLLYHAWNCICVQHSRYYNNSIPLARLKHLWNLTFFYVRRDVYWLPKSYVNGSRLWTNIWWYTGPAGASQISTGFA